MTVDDRLRAAHARIPDPDEATRRAGPRRAGPRRWPRRRSTPPRGGRAPPAPPTRASPRGDTRTRGDHAGRGNARTRASPAAQRADPASPAAPPPPPAPPAAATTPTRAPRPRLTGRTPRRRRPGFVLPVVALALAAVAAFALVPGTTRSRPGLPWPRRSTRSACSPPATCSYQRSTSVAVDQYIGADGRRVERPADAAYAIARGVPEERWIAPDGSGRIRSGRTTAPFLPSAEDERAWRAAGSPDLETLMPMFGEPAPKRRSFGPDALDTQLFANSNLEAVLPKRDPLSVVPHSPRGLRAFLLAAAAPGVAGPGTRPDHGRGAGVAHLSAHAGRSARRAARGRLDAPRREADRQARGWGGRAGPRAPLRSRGAPACWPMTPSRHGCSRWARRRAGACSGSRPSRSKRVGWSASASVHERTFEANVRSCRLGDMEPAVHRITIIAPQPPTVWQRLETVLADEWEPADHDDARGRTRSPSRATPATSCCARGSPTR